MHEHLEHVGETPESRELLDRIGRRMLKRRVDLLKNLPTFPQSILRMNAMLMSASDDRSFAQIAKTIETDPVVTARVLRLVNSAFYGVSGAITSVMDALVMLGLEVVRGLLLSTAALDIAEGRRGLGGMWEHSFGAAVAGGALAKELGLPNLEQVSAAALMHDIGKLVLASQLGHEYQQVIRHAVRRKLSIRSAELELLGVAHDEIGHWLVTRWRLPKALAMPIARHHEPETAGTHEVVTAAVHVADILVRAYGFGFAGDRIMPAISPVAWRMLGLNQVKLDRVVERMHEDLQTAMVQANLVMAP